MDLKTSTNGASLDGLVSGTHKQSGAFYAALAALSACNIGFFGGKMNR